MGSIRAAAEAAAITPTQHYKWIENDPAYWEAFSDAQMKVADALQDQVTDRAMGGWLEPVFYRGRQCGTIQHHSDRLLMLLLKAGMPEKYR
jgi:hypothetical protein